MVSIVLFIGLSFLNSIPEEGFSRADLRRQVVENYVMFSVCRSNVECREQRAEEISESVIGLLKTCDQEGVSDEWCASLAVTAVRESKFRAHPTCGVEASTTCVEDCDYNTLDTENDVDRSVERGRCLSACAKQAGEVPHKVARVAACNDHGSSRGYFQIKTTTLRRCERLMGEVVNPHYMPDAARCYISLVRASQQTLPSTCQISSSNWAVAWKRVGAGVFVRGTKDPQCSVSHYVTEARKVVRQIDDLERENPVFTESHLVR